MAHKTTILSYFLSLFHGSLMEKRLWEICENGLSITHRPYVIYPALCMSSQCFSLLCLSFLAIIFIVFVVDIIQQAIQGGE